MADGSSTPRRACSRLSSKDVPIRSSTDAPLSQDRVAAAQSFYGPLATASTAGRRVGWESDALQQIRHALLLEAAPDLSAVNSVVDIGCGEGVLLKRLRQAGYDGKYVGEDILEPMIERATASELHQSDANATFRCVDSLAVATPHDLVLCSGALNVAWHDDHQAQVLAALKLLWRRTRQVLVVDLAVVGPHPGGGGIVPVDIESVFAAARALSPVVALSEGALAGEAVLAIRRSPAAALHRLDVDPTDIAQAFVLAGHPADALAALGDLSDPRQALVGAEAHLHLEQLDEARALVATARTSPDAMIADGASLVDAGVRWRAGDRRGARMTLMTLIHAGGPQADDARIHLVEMLLAIGDSEAAREIAQTIEDTWSRRTALERLSPGRKPGE